MVRIQVRHSLDKIYISVLEDPKLKEKVIWWVDHQYNNYVYHENGYIVVKEFDGKEIVEALLNVTLQQIDEEYSCYIKDLTMKENMVDLIKEVDMFRVTGTCQQKVRVMRKVVELFSGSVLTKEQICEIFVNPSILYEFVDSYKKHFDYEIASYYLISKFR